MKFDVQSSLICGSPTKHIMKQDKQKFVIAPWPQTEHQNIRIEHDTSMMAASIAMKNHVGTHYSMTHIDQMTKIKNQDKIKIEVKHTLKNY